MKLFFATQNLHKVAEMQKILPGIHLMISPKFDCVEDGSDFMQNSVKKAHALFQTVNAPVIADDSGLCIDCLGGRPGIFSSRYGSDLRYGKFLCANQDEKNLAVIREVNETLGAQGMDSTLWENRKCRFICALTFMTAENRFICFQDTLEGCIAQSPAENPGGGFGYDPIVFLTEYGKTVAELSEDEKNRISHRGKAAAHLVKYLSALN